MTLVALVSSFRELDPVLQALLATCVTWALTAAGAGIVLFTRGVSLSRLLKYAAPPSHPERRRRVSA